jgi:hypothetical protein
LGTALRGVLGRGDVEYKIHLTAVILLSRLLRLPYG